MPWFRCYLEGENYALKSGGKPALLGFFTTRWVEAADAHEAENKAIDLIRGDKSLAHRPRAGFTPMIYVREIVEAPSKPDDAPNRGFTFFPMGT
jgi:hypothetical protein